MQLKIKIVFCTFILPCIICFCTKKIGKIPNGEPIVAPKYISFSNNIRPIILNKCANVNCHNTAFPFGDFTIIEEFKKRVDNGRFYFLVIEQQLMPPANEEQLSSQEFSLLKYWINNGAPFN